MIKNVNTTMHVMELFPTPVFIAQTNALDDHYLAQQIYAIREEEIASRISEKSGLSSYGGYRSYDLIQRDGFEELKQHILATLNEFMVKGKWFSESEVVPSQLGAMWGLINGKGHSNSTHNHPHSWISGVYYAKVPTESKLAGSLSFRDPILARTFTQSFYRSVQSEVCAITPEVGRMIMFPSWFEHSVSPNLTDEDRVAISFNIYHRK